MTKKLTPEEKAANLEARRAAKGGVAGKPKAPKKEKASKAKGKKTAKVVDIKGDAHGKPGHNSGKINAALQEIFKDYSALDEDAKAIAKAKRDLRAKAKDEHNVSAANFNHEVKLQKLEHDQRVMFEHGARDLKTMLGIQLALDLDGEEDELDTDDAPDPDEAARSAANH